MSLQVEKLDNNMAKLTIEVPAEELEKAIQAAYNKQKGSISLPGFRKGKAPRNVIEKMYGKEVFYEEAANALISSSYEKAYDECEEEIVSSPSINVVQLEAGKPFIYTAEVALKPGVTLGQYKGVEVAKVEVEVTDEEVAAALEAEQKKNARTIDVTDRAVANGDIATIDFEGFVDGVAFAGGKGEDYPLTIGSGAFIPGFEEALIGAEIGKEIDVNVTFPEEYQAAELAGKPAVFKCTVKKLQVNELPALDDDFASEVSDTADTLEDYKAEIKAKLAENKTAQAKNQKEDAVVDAVIANAEMNIPDAMVETQQRQIVQDYAQRLQSQGLSMEQYMQFTGMTVESLMEDVKPQAMKRIQSRLVLEAIVAAENIVASEEDFDAEVQDMAAQYQMEVEKAKELLGEGGKKQVMEDICIKKAVELIVSAAVEK